jgi:hypothetical protein
MATTPDSSETHSFEKVGCDGRFCAMVPYRKNRCGILSLYQAASATRTSGAPWDLDYLRPRCRFSENLDIESKLPQKVWDFCHRG